MYCFSLQTLLESVHNELYFNNAWLDPDDPQCTADEYFRQICYIVNLTDLYKVIATCYYNDEVKYCPILLEIGVDRIKQSFNNSNYLLQVWNMELKKVYELPLKNKFKIWTVTYRYLIFTLEQDNSDSEYLHIVDLDQNNGIIKVKNFAQGADVKYLSYNNSLLYCATDDEIRIVQVSSEKFTKEGTIIDALAEGTQIRVITPKYKIQGFVINIHCVNDKYQLVAIETPDNQLDFNKIFISDINTNSYTFRFEQYREIQPRGYFPNDPISKCCYIFSKGFNYSIALRKSGQFDIYWNMTRKDSIDHKVAVDIQMSITSFYFRMNDGKIYSFDHKQLSNIKFELAQNIPTKDVDFSTLHVKRVQNIVKLFCGFHIVRIGKTMLLIAHGKFVSLFDLLEWKWINHIEFEDDILYLFRHYKTSDSRYQTVLLNNGAIYIGVLDYDEYTQMVPTSKRSLKIEGQIIRGTEDIENNHTFYIVCKENGTLKMKVIYRGKLQDLTNTANMKDNCSVACLQYRGDQSYVVIQNDKTIVLYKQKDVSGSMTLETIQTFPEFTSINGIIHSATGYAITKHFFLFDAKNIYIIKIEPNTADCTCKVYENIYCIGFQNFTKQTNYAICQETSDSKNPGLRLFDMENIINRDKLDMTLLKKIDIGTQGYFEFGANVVRFGFVSSITHLVVTPILHRNMNKFIGIGSLDDYICYSVVKDKFIALTKKGVLTTWNLFTAKHEQTITLDQHVYTGWELITTYKDGPVLIKCNTKIENQNDSDYFQPWQLQTNLENQKAFLKTVTYSFHTWKYIEITSPNEVTVHLEYVQPSYAKQWIFVNKQKDRLITILSNYRTFYHKAVKTAGDPKITWELVRQIPDYPAELENDAGRLEFFSPCFTRYLVLDKRAHQFCVKDSSTGEILYRVPKDVMTLKKDDRNPSYVINRIKWLDAQTLQVLNEEGIENIVIIDKNFSETSYNIIPLFNEIDGVEWEKFHYYLHRSDLTTNQVLLRLKRFYQKYKTSYYLNRKHTINEMIEDMFVVDRYKFDFNETSFTFLNWSLIEQIQQDKLRIQDLELPTVESLLYNILPGGNTVLHRLCDQKDELVKLFEVCHPDQQIKYHVPYLPNIAGQSPFHMCIENADFKSINLILKYLKLYRIDHHSRAIKDLYPIILEQQLPSFFEYLDSRFQQTEQIKVIEKGSLKKDVDEIITSSVWFEKEEIEAKIFQKKQKIETSIRLDFLDMPGSYHFLDENFNSLFQQLAETDKYEYFNNKAIQKIIEFNYPLIREYMGYFLIIPFCTFHVLFVVYMNVVYEHRKDSHAYYLANYVISVTLLAFATYFLGHEARQLMKEGFNYITSIWNYIDIIAPLGIYILQVLQFLDLYEHEINEDFNRSVLAIVTFFMWFKLLYFMRIFRKTGYLIRMIIEVIYDMGIFLLLLLITVTAFGDSFLRLSQGNDDDNQFIDQSQFFLAALYAYRMILGDFATDAFGTTAVPLVWIFFILCTIFDMIVMLNLLIAIISDTYARVTANADQAAYQEMASLISENYFIIPPQKRKTYAEQEKFLVILTDLERVDKENVDPVIDKLSHLQKQILEMKKNMETMSQKQVTLIEDNNKTKKELLEKFTENMEKLKDVNKSKDEILEKLSKMNIAPGAPVAQANNSSPQKAAQPQVQKFMTKVHAREVEKTTLGQVKSINSDYNNNPWCSGRDFICKSFPAPIVSRNDANEAIYHCFVCGFDYCQSCYDTFKDGHNHPLQKSTLQEVRNKTGSYFSWHCDVAKFVPCTTKLQDNEPFYHGADSSFDLCESCFTQYKVV